MSTKGIPKMIVKAGNGAKKFLEKLEEVSLDIQYGQKTLAAADIQSAIDFSDPKKRKQIVLDTSFFKDPSVNSLTVLLKTLNGYELCNPFSFALNQAFPPGSPVATAFSRAQGKLKDVFEGLRNFSIIPGNVEVTGVVSVPDPLSDADFGGFTFETNKGTQVITLPENSPFMANGTVLYLYQTDDPKVNSFLTCRVITSFDATGDDFGEAFVTDTSVGKSYQIEIESRSTTDPPYQLNPNGTPVLDGNGIEVPRVFENFKISFEKKATTDTRELSEELLSIANLLKEIGYEDILNDLDGIPSSFPGVGKIKETAVKVGAFINQVGAGASSAGNQVGVAAGALAGGLTTRQVIENSKLLQDFVRKLEPILNFQNTLASGYKDVVENLNNTLRNAIPYGELSKFVKFIVNFAQIIEGVVSFLITLLKTLNSIVKTVTTILKVFKVVIKVIKVAISALPSLFTTVGIIQQISDKLDQAEEALGLAITFLENISKFLDRITARLTSLKGALRILILEGTQLAAKLNSCEALKGNGLGEGMQQFVSQIRTSLRGLTGASPREDYYPDDPNAPGSGINTEDMPDGVDTVITTGNGEIIFVEGTIIGFDGEGNLIFLGELTSLSTGVAFNDTLGQRFRNENLRYYTFDKFRNSQLGLLDAADQIAFNRINRIQEVDPEDRFGNFAENYLGYTIKIQEETTQDPNAQIATRRRGIALDNNEKIVVSTSLTFSTDLAGIVNEVKFLLRRDIEEGILGVNTTDNQPNEISDTDAVNLAETVGANPIALNNLKAENNNKTAATIKQLPPTENPTRIGNRPYTQDISEKPAQQKSQGNSPAKTINTKGIARSGLDQFIADTPSLSGLASNLNSINSATPSQLSNILKEPGVENLSEEELVKKLKGEILSSIDPNPEKIEEVKEKTQNWYKGIRGKARVDFDRLKLSARIPKGGGKVFGSPDAYEFEPYISKIEKQEIPKWVKLLQRSGYTEAEIQAGLSNEGISDKYDITFDDKGKIDIRKKTAFKESNF